MIARAPARPGAALLGLLAALAAAPAALAGEGTALPDIGYDDGFYARDASGDYSLKLKAQLQARFAFASEERALDPPTADPVTGEPDLTDQTDRDNSYAFSIPRAQLKLGGTVFSKAIRFAFQTEFGKGSPLLKDAYADFALLPGALHLRAGQWKRPFSRQWLTSAAAQEFVDRAITHTVFDPGRDLGVGFHNDFLESPRFEWALGVFNGTGYVPWFEGHVTLDEDGEGPVEDGAFTNVPDRFSPMLVARLGFNHGGIDGYSEADLEGGGFRLALGASALAELDADNDGASHVRAEADFVIKAHGFATSGAVYVAAAQEDGDFADQEYAGWGMHLQAGYVIASLVQPVVRYALIDPTGDAGTIHDVTGGLALYLRGHDVKWQVDGGARLHDSPEVGDLIDWVARTQVQLAF